MKFELTHRRRRFTQSGFSLIEMLIVIAVVAIIAGIGLQSISLTHDKADEAKARANAQKIATIGASAQVAGFDYVSTSKDGAVAELVTGVWGTGVMSDMHFKVGTLDATEMGQAMVFLDFVDSRLVYNARY